MMKLEYDKLKAGTDLFDMYLEQIHSTYKCFKPWMPHYLWLWEGCVVNAHLYWNVTHPEDTHTLVESVMILLDELEEKAQKLEKCERNKTKNKNNQTNNTQEKRQTTQTKGCRKRKQVQSKNINERKGQQEQGNQTTPDQTRLD